EHRERPALEPGEADAGEQIGNRASRAAADAETDRAALPRQRQEVLDGDRQRRIDRKRLRDVADGAAAAPVEGDAAVERRLAENSEQQGALAGAVRPDDDMQRAAFDVYRDAVEQRLAMAANGDAFDLDDCRPGRFLDHASVTSARIMVSAFRCIS